jgi:hypothetical protein
MTKEKIYHRQRPIVAFAIILLIALVLAEALIPTAHAEILDPVDYEAQLHNIREGAAGDIGAAAYNFVAIATGVHPTLSVGGIVSSLVRVDQDQVAYQGGGRGSIVDLAKSVYEVLKIVGVLLMLLYLLIDVLDEVQTDHFTVEHLIKKLISFAVALLVLQYGADILANIVYFGNELADDVNVAWATGNTLTGQMGALYASLVQTDLGIFETIGVLMQCLGVIADNIVGYLLSFLSVLFVWLTCFSRFIEILIRFSLAPIGMAPLVSGGAKGAGMRYIKKFASVVIQGAVIVTAVRAAAAISSYSSGVNAVIMPILMPLTLIGFLSKVPAIADDVVGV